MYIVATPKFHSKIIAQLVYHVTWFILRCLKMFAKAIETKNMNILFFFLIKKGYELEETREISGPPTINL